MNLQIAMSKFVETKKIIVQYTIVWNDNAVCLQTSLLLESLFC